MQLEGVVREAEKVASPSTETSLAEALVELRSARVEENLTKQEKHNETLRQSLEDEEQQKVDRRVREQAKERSDKNKELADLKQQGYLDKNKADQEAEKQRIAKVRKKDLEDKLEREFQAELPDIKKYLSAFLKPGMKLRSRNAPPDPGPASFSALAWATANTDAGLESLVHAMNPHTNDRSSHKWASHFHYQKRGNWAYVDMSFPRRAHKLLMKWGPTLVKKGMLAE